jgi:hypothetical protein
MCAIFQLLVVVIAVCSIQIEGTRLSLLMERLRIRNQIGNQAVAED